MQLTRREFVQTGSVSLIGFSLWKATRAWGGTKKVAEVPLIWMTTSGCGGCSASLLDSAAPRIEEALLGKIVPGKHLSLTFHSLLMAGAGEMAMQHLDRVTAAHRGRYFLVVEGSISTKEGGRYCRVGERDGHPVTALAAVHELARHARAVLAVGTCGSFGGMAAAPPNPTGCVGTAELLRGRGVRTAVVNIPGCPPHPDWIVGTLAAILMGGLKSVPLDGLLRPKAFYSSLIHDHCPHRGDFDRGRFAEHFGQHACLFKLGCKGPVTVADCPQRAWNQSRNWCISAGHPCLGCTERAFPYKKSLFQRVQQSQLGFPAIYSEAKKQKSQRATADTYVTIGLLGAGGFVAGAGTAMAARRLRRDGRTKDQAPPSAEPPDAGEKGKSDGRD